jgi:hypothetical protein
MNKHKNFSILVSAIIGSLVVHSTSEAADGRIQLRAEGSNAFVQVLGDKDHDWRIQTSGDLVNWNTLTSLGTLLSGGTNGPARSLGSPIDSQRFYRAVKTDGLFDPTLLRTISLTFTQANWQTRLAEGRNTGSNTLGNLVMDNGATNLGVGVRYKGNSSYSAGGIKKSVNIELDYRDPAGVLMGYETINLNNAAGDETIMREPLYFNVMQQYTVSPKGSLAKLFINGEFWGVYSLIQQENGQLINEWFPSNDGDRWRAPNSGGGGGGGGGGFSSPLSALSYRGTTNAAIYRSNYELKTDNSTNAWERLVHAIVVLNNTPAELFRDKVEDVLAVDRWLWFLAIENIFADDDSYWNKGADYGFYYEPESGQIHPIEHDGNEAFTAGDVQLSPVQGATGTNRPVLYKLLPVPELRQRYLAHMRTVLRESYHPTVMTPLIDQYSALSLADITADTKKSFTMTAYRSDLAALKTFITNRYNFLLAHAELRPVPPTIVSVNGPTSAPTAYQVPFITAQVLADGTNGIDSVWLYYRVKPYGRFSTTRMFDDGAHRDGSANDGTFGAATTNYPPGTKVRYYVEARSANSAKAANFAPARAEHETYDYRVGMATAPNSPVVINELMASNTSTVADPQGEFDDWIELRNITDQELNLTGCYLTDEPNNPRKWLFPAGTTIPPGGFLVVWADEDGSQTPGLHANFKLSASGEPILLIDTDQNSNSVLDSVTFASQNAGLSYGRQSANPDVFAILAPTPGQPNP